MTVLDGSCFHLALRQANASAAVLAARESIKQQMEAVGGLRLEKSFCWSFVWKCWQFLGTSNLDGVCWRFEVSSGVV